MFGDEEVELCGEVHEAWELFFGHPCRNIQRNLGVHFKNSRFSLERWQPVKEIEGGRANHVSPNPINHEGSIGNKLNLQEPETQEQSRSVIENRCLLFDAVPAVNL